ncbi:rhodanese-like domain-containing protein [Phycicoccus sp.]|uniref:rhodanese-like domain-containing protein n=1 Tax=Phycicoccus sp. TaxID=1902410 RepID=UPI002BCC7687|nr:rhodanese-like domain-containing protein [Phycicoccus sp.]HMM95973.1 rhodanese-like domain-containing protein [Phycicoccus sp.]
MPLRRLLAALALSLLATGSLAACGDGGADVSATAGAAATAAPAAGSHLDAAGFAAALRRPGTTVLDVRTPAEFAAGHLPGAVNVDIEGAAFGTQLAALDPAGAYAVYCRSGSRSAAALDAMAQAGFTGAYDLAGGIGAWQQAGGEVVTG